MAVVVGRMVAILEAQTAAFESRMNAASQQMHRFGGTTGSARQGVFLLRSGLQTLATSGFGALPGPIGRVAAGLGVLTLGSPLALGVLAGAGALALVFRSMAKAAEETDRRLAGLRRQLISLRDAQVGGLEAQIVAINFPEKGKSSLELELQRQQLVKRIAEEQRTGTPIVSVQRLVEIGEELALRKAIVEELEKQIRKIKELRVAELERIAAARNVLKPGEAMTFRGNLPPGMLLPGAPAQDVPAILRGSGFQGITSPRPGPRTGFQLTPEFAIMSAMALMQGAQQGPAGFFGAAAAPVAMINPLAGAITAGIGGIFSLFDQKASERELAEERRHKELIGVLHEGPARVTNIFDAGADPETALYESDRQRRLGGEPHLGGL